MRKYYNHISLWSRIVNFSFRFSNYKKKSETVEGTKKYIEELKDINKRYNLPKKIGLDKIDFNGMDVYSYNGNISSDKKILLYIHGGSYIEEATRFQIKFAMKIAEKTNSVLVFPRYPLAPEGSYKTMYPLIEKLYNKLLDCNTEINFLGDSAGGGFILSFSMYLRDNNIMQPKNIIMLSPWLDVSLSNPYIYEDAKVDNMCGVDGTRYCGTLWANGLDLKNPLISPMFGNFDNLGRMTIIVGESGILKSECHNFSDLLTSNNIEHNFIEYKGQGHVFGAYPTKEGNLVIGDISKIINNS